jgi:hypothetical protein
MDIGEWIYGVEISVTMLSVTEPELCCGRHVGSERLLGKR